MLAYDYALCRTAVTNLPPVFGGCIYFLYSWKAKVSFLINCITGNIPFFISVQNVRLTLQFLNIFLNQTTSYEN